MWAVFLLLLVAVAQGPTSTSAEIQNEVADMLVEEDTLDNHIEADLDFDRKKRPKPGKKKPSKKPSKKPITSKPATGSGTVPKPVKPGKKPPKKKPGKKKPGKRPTKPKPSTGTGSGSGTVPNPVKPGKKPSKKPGKKPGKKPAKKPGKKPSKKPSGKPAPPIPPPNPGPTNLPPIETVAKVKFTLFTGLTQQEESIDFDGATATLAPNTKFNPSKPIKIVVHGWSQASLVNGQVVEDHDNYPLSFNKLYKTNGLDYTVLGVHWVPFDGWQEYLQTSSSSDAANTIALLLSALARDHNISGSQVHMIGFSMGTVVTSKTAKKIQELGMNAMSRATLLDPCPTEQAAVISKTDADFVEAIHTSSQDICSEIPLAHVDFYPNGGDAQICGSSPCNCLDGSSVCYNCYHGKSRCLNAFGFPDWVVNHLRAVDLYRESIGRPTAFLSWKCSETYQQFVDNGRRCANGEVWRMVPMGEHSLDGGRPRDGLYYLETSGEPPFYN